MKMQNLDFVEESVPSMGYRLKQMEEVYKMKLNEFATEAVEICPFCESENVYTNWDAEKQGYVTKCQTCGEEIMLCDECRHADDNRVGKCDWQGYTQGECSEGKCFRGATHHKESQEE